MSFPNDPDWAGYITLDGTEYIGTSGGEYESDDLKLDSYEVNFDKVSVMNLTPRQMICLAVEVVNHLMLNGHKFEIRESNSQDQTHCFICLI